MLGFSNEYKAKKTPKFVKVYKSFDIELSVKKFCDEVRSGIFPNDEYFYMKNKTTSNNITYIKFDKKK